MLQDTSLSNPDDSSTSPVRVTHCPSLPLFHTASFSVSISRGRHKLVCMCTILCSIYLAFTHCYCEFVLLILYIMYAWFLCFQWFCQHQRSMRGCVRSLQSRATRCSCADKHDTCSLANVCVCACISELVLAAMREIMYLAFCSVFTNIVLNRCCVEFFSSGVLRFWCCGFGL